MSLDFICNICSTPNSGVEEFGREVPNCSGCGSSVRVRALLAALSRELFGVSLKLADFPILKTIRGEGMSDAESYAGVLADRFFYRNTFFDRAPKLDITAPGGTDTGTLDFLLAAEVFEHVRPPAQQAFRNAWELLKPEGVLVMSVPYKPDGETEEHFPDLCDYGTVALREGAVLVNRTAAGTLQVFPNLVFHGGEGSTLEMRRFSEAGLRQTLADAGFGYVRIYAEDVPEYGIVHQETWSLPIAARRQAPDGNRETHTELIRQFQQARERERTLLAKVQDLESELATARAWAAGLESELRGAESGLRAEQEEQRRLHEELRQRTEWARELDAKVEAEAQQRALLMGEVEKRTTWARGLESELAEKTQWAVDLDAELRTRTEWARGLERQLGERTEWAQATEQRAKQLEAELQQIRAAGWWRIGKLLRLI